MGEHWLKKQIMEAHDVLDGVGVPVSEKRPDSRALHGVNVFSLGVPDRIKWMQRNFTPSCWEPVADLPPPGERPGTALVIVEGERQHSGMETRWHRMQMGTARTDNDGFLADDIRAIEERGDMDEHSGRVTYWMRMPPYPPSATRT